MVTNKKQGRNEPCECGSGKKFKKCRGAEEQPPVTVGEMLKCLYLLLEGASAGNLAIPKGAVPFKKELLDSVPKDFIKNMVVGEVDGFVMLGVKPKPKKKRSLITVPKLYTGP